MSTLEDKILDGPTVHYCEADNDDIRTGEDGNSEPEDNPSHGNEISDLFTRPDPESDQKSSIQRARSTGYSRNTGPKGVIADHRKQSATKSNADDIDLDDEFRALMNDDSIIKRLTEKRMAELSCQPSFGLVYRLQTGPELLDAIDKEHPNVLLIVHIYTKFSRSCAKVDKCLDSLADQYKQVKFVTLDAKTTGLSENFKENGVPALLAYKAGNLVKSLVKLEDLLDKDFDTTQLKELLIDNGIIIC